MYYHTKYKIRLNINQHTDCNNTTTPHRQTNTHTVVLKQYPNCKER